MRSTRALPLAFAASLTTLLAACAGAPVGGAENPFAAAGPPPEGLFISPFGEIFVSAPDAAWPSADWFAGADSNRDGAVDFEEFAADGRRWFTTLDTDRDGRLNQTEMLAYEARLRELSTDEQGGGSRFGPGVGLGERVRMRPGGGAVRRQVQRDRNGQIIYGVVAEAGYFNLPQPVKAADVNIDQRLTAEEWAAATQRWFLALDTDRDGRLTLATLPQTPLQRRRSR